MARRRRGSEIDDTLGAEVRRLGNSLGEVIAQLEGPRVFARVEQLRRWAKARRSGDGRAGAQLARSLAGMNAADAFNQAMAFTLYFELVNLAEENFRIKILRSRRRMVAEAGDSRQPMRETILAAIAELKRRGRSTAFVQKLVDSLGLELVFTAHPTESKRRTLLAKLARLGEMLRESSRSGNGEGGPAVVLGHEVKREIASLWLTDRSRAERPEVTDEARTGLWYFDTALFSTVPELQRDLERALRLVYPKVKVPLRWITFGSWIGGDRDGNPNVTARVTEEVLLLHRRLALGKTRFAARALARSLTVSDRRDPNIPEFSDPLKIKFPVSPALQELERRYPHEHYRWLLGAVRERLGREAAAIAGDVEIKAISDGSLLNDTDLADALRALENSLRAGRGALLADGELKTFQDQLRIFGLHTARLDLRQHSTPHEAAVSELLGRADYPGLPEARKREVLLEALRKAAALGDEAVGKLTAETQHVVQPIALAARAQRCFGEAAIGIYIISMTDDVSDLLEAELLLAKGGASMPVAPLFETLDDLERAPKILDEYFSLPGRAVPAHQHVMLGYSDSNKDCGYLSANWALFLAQEKIAALFTLRKIQLTLFHGRGGSIARGGGPAAKAILAQPAGLRDGKIRVTEQGEVLSTRYHQPDLAHRILEQMAYGVILGADAARHPQKIPVAWRNALTEMSAVAVRCYQGTVRNDPDFLTFWKQATPIDEISNLKFGSRPTFRKATTSVDDLRAIPWVFSWMQSRFNFSGWFGLGAALETFLGGGAAARGLLRKMYREWPFFQTLIDNAQLTMRKADMEIAALYAGLVEDAKIREKIFGLLRSEFRRTEESILAVTGEKSLLENEPVLHRSVELRNPYIDPLNFLQVEMIRRLRSGALSEADTESTRRVVELTINGISAGLKNTG